MNINAIVKNMQSTLFYRGNVEKISQNYIVLVTLLLSLVMKNSSMMYIYITLFFFIIQILTCTTVSCNGVSLVWCGLLGVALVELGHFPLNYFDIFTLINTLYALLSPFDPHAMITHVAHTIAIICGSILMFSLRYYKDDRI